MKPLPRSLASSLARTPSASCAHAHARARDAQGAEFLKRTAEAAQEQAQRDMQMVAGGAPPRALSSSPASAPFSHAAAPGIRMLHGTTTLAFLFKHGVLVAVDSRASMGSYIGSGTVKKVITINRYLLGTMAGGAADCSFWERQLAFRTRVHELKEGRRMTVAAASKLLANTTYSYRNYGLSMGTMIAGWDENAGPALFYVDSDGTRLKGSLFSVGSGSTYAMGVLDTEYRFDLSIEDAVELGKRAIWHAAHRDAYSGGTINVFVITGDGWRQHVSIDHADLFYGQYAKEREAARARPEEAKMRDE